MLARNERKSSEFLLNKRTDAFNFATATAMVLLAKAKHEAQRKKEIL